MEEGLATSRELSTSAQLSRRPGLQQYYSRFMAMRAALLCLNLSHMYKTGDRVSLLVLHSLMAEFRSWEVLTPWSWWRRGRPSPCLTAPGSTCHSSSHQLRRAGHCTTACWSVPTRSWLSTPSPPSLLTWVSGRSVISLFMNICCKELSGGISG